MVFKKLRASLGSGVSVDTVLSNPNCTPGGVLTGEVRFTGGKVDYEVEGITLALAARVEIDTDDGEYHTTMEFARSQVAGRFHLPEGAQHAIGFQLAVPWETPITAVFGQQMRGMSIGLATELELKGALDKGDSDPIQVHAMPAQQAFLDGLGRLGFRFKGADLEKGSLHGSRMPFYQEIEFYPGPSYSHRMSQLEVTFIAGEHSMDVLLEMDKRGGFLRAGGDAYNRFPVPYNEVQSIDWAAWLDQRFAALGVR